MMGQALDFGVKLLHKDLDVTRPEQIKTVCENLKPTGLVCLSSLDLRRCEESPYKAVETNVLGVYHLAQETSRRSIPLVIVSTGAVFNGPLHSVFDEMSEPSPLHLYGQTKWLAEIMAKMAPHLCILRTGWLFGGSSVYHKNFIDLAFEKALRGEPIKASTDQTGSPTYLPDFVNKLGQLLKQGETGLHHVVNDGPATAYDIATILVEVLKSSSKIEIVPANQISNAGPRRSPSEALISKKIKLRSWKEALTEYLQKKLSTQRV